MRSALHPRIEELGLIAPHKLLNFGNVKDSDGRTVLAASVGNGDLLDTDDRAHDFGCRVANKARAYKSKKAGVPLEELARPSVHYVAALDLRVERLTALGDQKFRVSLGDASSDELPEHMHIEVSVVEANLLDPEKAAIRTDAVDQIFRLLHNPRTYICDCDLDLRDLIEGAWEIILANFSTSADPARE